MWWSDLIIPFLIPLSIIMLIIYLKNQKLSTLCFSLSAITYVIAVLYAIDKFKFRENSIFLIFVFSALLMVSLGLYIGYNRKNANSKKNK